MLIFGLFEKHILPHFFVDIHFHKQKSRINSIRKSTYTSSNRLIKGANDRPGNYNRGTSRPGFQSTSSHKIQQSYRNRARRMQNYQQFRNSALSSMQGGGACGRTVGRC